MNCGKRIEANNKFCSACGKQAESTAETAVPTLSPNYETQKRTDVLTDDKNIRIFAMLISAFMIATLLLPWLSVSRTINLNVASGYSPLQTVIGFGRVGTELNNMYESSEARRDDLWRRMDSLFDGHGDVALRERLRDSYWDELDAIERTRTSVSALRISMVGLGVLLLFVHVRVIYKIATNRSTETFQGYKKVRFANLLSIILTLLFLILAFYMFSTVRSPRDTWVSISMIPWLVLCCGVLGIIVSTKGMRIASEK